MRRTIACIAFAALVLVAGAPRADTFAEANKAQPLTPNAAAVGTPVGQPVFVIQQPATGGVINIGQAFGSVAEPYINALVQALVAAAMGWIFWLLKTKLNINIDAEHRASITQAVQRQASSLIADGAVAMEGKAVKVDNAALAQAVNMAIAAAPDAVARFGLTPERVEARIIDMIPQAPAGAQIVAAAHANGNGHADPAPPAPGTGPNLG